MHHLLFLLAAIFHLTIALPTLQNETFDLQPRQKSCAVNERNMQYKKEFNQGFCTRTILQAGPSDKVYDDTIPLDFDFEYKLNICGFHVYLDYECKVCASKTLYRGSVKTGDDGIACVSQQAHGGWFRSIKAAPCDGSGVGCWKWPEKGSDEGGDHEGGDYDGGDYDGDDHEGK